MVNTPVLYITFARPEYASQSFAAIKKAKPRKLYFYSNKARNDKPNEMLRNDEVRSYINQIDWDCEIVTWFRDEYVDVFTSLWGAIDWVFQNEEEAIIIEEDVVTCSAFFDYMDKLIVKYRDNEKVWMISGNNGAPRFSPANSKIFPIRLADIYGWASWKKVWEKVDWNMSGWLNSDAKRNLRKYWGNPWLNIYYSFFYKKFYKRITTSNFKPWDSIFLFSMRLNNGYCLIPNTNLSIDIGTVGENHKYNEVSSLNKISVTTETFEINDFPQSFAPNSYDWKYFSHIRIPALFRRKIRAIFS